MNTILMFLLAILGVAGLWDGFTTFYGSYSILGGSETSLIVSIIFSVIITAFLFLTSYIWNENLNDEFIGYLLRGFWIIAFVYDVFTSFIGNKDIIVKEMASFSQIAVLLGITTLVSGSPIVFSYLVSFIDQEKRG